ncbi:MAG: methyltransferase regulatory domain-containing protein [Alphaproteobacteria bacterium]|nr:methyltransferase regulatory domain-containing protein [Alphaproteobacteria bacterium]
MPETPATAYDAVPYTSHAYERTQPTRLAAMARLFGVEAPDPRTARVLEIGCGRGGNVVPMASASPEARFVGLDLSRVQVDEAQALARRLGLTNLDLRHADILDVDDAWGSFDYVIAHGIWSWVPEAVRAAILQLVRDRLTPHGVAYVSYNVLPGWRMRGMVADLMRYHTRRLTDPAARVHHARTVLEFLAKVRGPEVHTPYTDALHEESSTLAGLPDAYLLHDHLGEVNHAVYVHDFVQQAQEHGLAFLSEASLSDMMPSGLGAEATAFLQRIPDQVEREQYLDFLVNRAFRATLLVHGERTISRRLGPTSLGGLHLQCAGTFTTEGPLADPTVAGTLELAGRTSRTSAPIAKAAMHHLCARWPASVPFEELVDVARAEVGSTRPVADDRADVGGVLLQGVLHRLFLLRADPSPAVADTVPGRLFPPARLQIEDGADLVVSALHTHVRVDPDDARTLLDLDRISPAARARVARMGLLVA